MGKTQSETRGSNPTKAGKKSGSYQEPPMPNLEKQRLREMGNQQFFAKTQLTVPATKIVVDKNTGRIMTKVYDHPVSFLWDETRKHFIYSPLTGKDIDGD